MWPRPLVRRYCLARLPALLAAPALATRPACTSTSLAAPAQFLQIFIQSCVCLHTDNTQLCPVCVWRLWSVWCLYGELPLPPSWHCLLSLSISRWTVWAGQQQCWAAHRKLETILCDICPSPRQPASRSRWRHEAADCRTVMSSYHPPIEL